MVNLTKLFQKKLLIHRMYRENSLLQDVSILLVSILITMAGMFFQHLSHLVRMLSGENVQIIHFDFIH